MDTTAKRIAENYRKAKDKRKQIGYLAAMYHCSEEQIREALIDSGIDRRQLPRKRKEVADVQMPTEGKAEQETGQKPEGTSLYDECEDDTGDERREFDRFIIRIALEMYRDDRKKVMGDLEKTSREISRCVERAEQMLAERRKKTCKDCLHYKMCDYGRIGRLCSDITDKSEWVHLPCKAGDTIFLPWQWNGESGIARITVLRVVLTEDESYIETDFDSDDYDYFMKYNCGVFRFGDFGKIVFTTKEEAEKALMGRRKDNAELH